ncbi:N-acetyl-gamma-glutamyl-phosphate reductase [Candidatus Acetothermia bacterium]|nr:N-acetyl-gamma-glutamyl-phosphate reductase [Candidatus Acetothermia bacterium]MBI3643938.1 N-acetyl-gamma-glutamyl-phosphate reductase [Candidatus Acetothermia bacterium]
MTEIQAAVVGGSGYTGGELLRLLLRHPEIELTGIVSRSQAGKAVHRAHPNLRGVTDLKFISPDALSTSDLIFLALPHGTAMSEIDRYLKAADRVIDLSADFRLREPASYPTWYEHEHPRPELLEQFVYGMPELHRAEIKGARWVAVPGCTATAAIIPLKPIIDTFKVKFVVVDAKVGSSAGGTLPGPDSHHPERVGVVRSFKPTGHRHLAEMEQELNPSGEISISFSPHAVELVRGILATCHVFFADSGYSEKEVWQAYLSAYKEEPFVRFVKERTGIYRFPEPKLVAGTNFCDIGFERDEHSGRLVVMCAIDNLMKGAAGQAVQCMNLMFGFDERMGLEAWALHP